MKWGKVVLLSVLLATPTSPVWGADITIAVASNFSQTLFKLTEMFKAQNSQNFVVINGSSGKLTNMIKHGAPIDIFFAADTSYPQVLKALGLSSPKMDGVYAQGHLAFWTPRGTPNLKNLDKLSGGIAIANPRLAPYGRAAQQTLKNLGVWQSKQSQIRTGESISQAYQLVHSGAVESGFVALSQLLRNNIPKAQYEIVSNNYHAPISQGVILLKHGAENESAPAFICFLASVEAQTVIGNDGYTQLPMNFPGCTE